MPLQLVPLYPGEAMYGAGSGFENVTPSQMYTPGGAGGGGGGDGEFAGVGGSYAAGGGGGGGGGGASSGPDSVAGRGRRVYSLFTRPQLPALTRLVFHRSRPIKRDVFSFPPRSCRKLSSENVLRE